MENDQTILGQASKRLEALATGRFLMSEAEKWAFENEVLPKLERLKKDFKEGQVPQIFFPLIGECTNFICKNEGLSLNETSVDIPKVGVVKKENISFTTTATTSLSLDLANEEGVSHLLKLFWDNNGDLSKILIPRIDIVLAGRTGKTDNTEKWISYMGLVLQFDSFNRTLSCFGGGLISGRPSILTRAKVSEEAILKFTEDIMAGLAGKKYFCSLEDSKFYENPYAHEFSLKKIMKEGRGPNNLENFAYLFNPLANYLHS